VGEVSVDVDAAVLLRADRILLERALDALVAIAGREGTTVRISVEPSGSDLSLVVAGRAPESPTVDDPEKGSPSEPRGRALALPVVRRIAATLGGAFSLSGDRYVLTLRRPERDASLKDPTIHP
jgi:hypothetical protein